MNTCNYLKELRTLNDREKIYKKYHEAQNDPAALQQLRETLSEDYAAENHLILPQLYPDCCPGANAFSERHWRDPSENIMLVKHDCYQPFYPHRHDCFELVCALDGPCEEDTDDHHFTMKRGDICFFPPGACHSTEVTDDSVVINILIRQATFNDTFFSLFRHKTILTDFFSQDISSEIRYPRIIFSTGKDRDVQRMILEMLEEYRQNAEFCDDVLGHLLSLFFIYLIRNYKNRVRIPVQKRAITSRQADILFYIRENYKTVTLAQAAEHFHYSESYCSRYIKEATGHNFVSLLREIRLRHAERLLANTDITVEDLAEEVGYDNPETLIKVFRQQRNMTPGQYRTYIRQSRADGR